ncbi:MAG: CNNM domain-containing protein, partial [Candidatus Saganbacteria bacterium]|nr:CNNM domain-containing protein [Candidatus Saganbacteria bacterium]
MSAIEVLILIILVLLSAFFSASETALTSVQRFKVRKLVMEKAIGAKALQYLVESPAEMLSTVLISSTFVNICASVLAGSIAVRYTSSLGSEGLAIGVATGIMAFIILVFAEITPKTTAIRNAERVAVFVAPVILVFEFILRPVAFLLAS